MRKLIEAVTPITESDGEYTPIINAALDGLTKAFDALEEAIMSETRRMLAEQSMQWPNSIVAVFTGHGMSNVEIAPSDELIASMAADHEAGSEEEEAFWNIVETVKEFCDQDHNPLLHFYNELDGEHRGCIPDFGFICFLNGKEVDQNTYDARRNAVPRNLIEYFR